MKYSPLAVHCTSLCLDVVSGSGFSNLSEIEINACYPDVYALVYQRLETPTTSVSVAQSLATIVARKILALLCYLIRHPDEIDSGRILYGIDQAIHLHLAA